MALHNQSFYVTEVLTARARRILAHLRKDEIVVTIGEHARNRDALLYANLVVMAVYSQALHGVLLGDLETRVVIVQGQVHVLYRRRMVALLRRPRLVLVLRHTLSTRVLPLAHRLLSRR